MHCLPAGFPSVLGLVEVLFQVLFLYKKVMHLGGQSEGGLLKP